VSDCVALTDRLYCAGLHVDLTLYVRLPHSSDSAAFRNDLFNIARTTLSSKVLAQDKEYFANLAVDAVLRLKGSTDLDHIQIIKKVGGKLTDSYLDEGA
jgi:T-complex protein 1 subunit beta